LRCFAISSYLLSQVPTIVVELDLDVSMSPRSWVSQPVSHLVSLSVGEAGSTFEAKLLEAVRENGGYLRGIMGYVWCLVELKGGQLGISPGDMPYAALPTRPDMKALKEEAVQVRNEFIQFQKEKDWVKKVPFDPLKGGGGGAFVGSGGRKLFDCSALGS
jgi:hypothetical protein